MEGLHQARPCGCKGIRTCLACEKQGTTAAPPATASDPKTLWRYCCMCGKVQPPPESDDQLALSSCTGLHANKGFVLPGILVIPDFISDEEESEIVHTIDESPWKPSQSGRHKQDYGPKPNFKRKKVKKGGFTGLPPFSRPLVTRMAQIDVLQDFVPVEQCHLDYRPDRGSAIDLHFDDFWLWGNRLVTINLLSDTFLFLKRDSEYADSVDGRGQRSFSNPCRDNGRILSGVETLSAQTLPLDGTAPSSGMLSATTVPGDGTSSRTLSAGTFPVDELLIPMPRKSLFVLSDDARYKWKHAVPREAITSRRIALTLRELTPEFMPGGTQEVVGRELVDTALTYEGSVVQ